MARRRACREACSFSFAAKLGNKGPDVWVVKLLLEVGTRVYCWVNRYLAMQAGEALGTCQHVEGI